MEFKFCLVLLCARSEVVDESKLLSHNWIGQIVMGKCMTRHSLALEESKKIMFKGLLMAIIKRKLIGCNAL